MAAREESGKVVQVGDRVRIVFHGDYEGEPLAGRPGYEIDTEHEVTAVGPDDVLINGDIFVLYEEIEVIK